MKILDFETVDSLPCLYHPGTDMLVLSDIHLGFEGTATADGNYVPKIQLDELLEDIRKAKEETGASRILVNGDLKNEFSTSRFSESMEIEDMLDFLEEEFEESIIVRGNHDTFVEKTVNEYGLELEKSHLENGVLFTHGHMTLEELDTDDFDTVVIGHEHPSLALKDEIGVREKVAAFLYGEMEDGKKIVVLPAFSMISKGTDINEAPQSELLSPLLRNQVDLDKLKAVAVSREAGLFEFPELGKLE